MKTSRLTFLVALIAPVSFVWATAQVDPAKLPKVDCSSFKFSSAFLEKYPRAPAACLEGRVYQGTTYAKFHAKVYINHLPDYLTLQLMNVVGTMITTFSVKPQGGGTFYVDGKETSAADLKVGQKVTLWVPEGRMEAKVLPVPTEESWRVIPPQK
jgi:hypothetical protein